MLCWFGNFRGDGIDTPGEKKQRNWTADESQICNYGPNKQDGRKYYTMERDDRQIPQTYWEWTTDQHVWEGMWTQINSQMKVQSSICDTIQCTISTVNCPPSCQNRDAVDRQLAYVLKPQTYKGDPRPCTLPRVMASSATGLKLGVFGFLPTTHAKTNAKQVHPQSLCAMWCTYPCLSLHLNCSRCSWLTQMTNNDYFDHGEPQRPPIWAPYWD